MQSNNAIPMLQENLGKHLHPRLGESVPDPLEAMFQSTIGFMQKLLSFSPAYLSDILIERYRERREASDVHTPEECDSEVSQILADVEISLQAHLKYVGKTLEISALESLTQRQISDYLFFIGSGCPDVFVQGHKISIEPDDDMRTIGSETVDRESFGRFLEVFGGINPDQDEIIGSDSKYRKEISPTTIEKVSRIGNSGSLAKLANRSELKKLTSRKSGVTAIPGSFIFAETSSDGSVVRCSEKSETMYWDQDRLQRHILCVGGTGSGKTTRWILPLIRGEISQKNKTVIVFDPKGELLPVVRALTLAYRSYEPMILNFRDPAGSIGWNPLSTVQSVGDTLEIAHSICHAAEIDGGGAGETPFWRNSSIELLSCILQGIIRDPTEESSLARALDIACLPIKEFAAFADRFPDIRGMAKFVEFMRSGSQNADTIQQDLRMRMNPWRDERVAAVTAIDEFRISDLCNRPNVLILQLNEEDVEFLKPVTNLFMTALFRELLIEARKSAGNKLAIPVSIIIEEFASAIGRIWGLDQRINTIRQRSVSIAASVQSLDQIRYQYGTKAAGVFAGFSSLVAFPDLTLNDAREVSDRIGRSLFDDIEKTKTTNSEEWTQEEATETHRSVTRPILDESAILGGPSHREHGSACTILTPGIPPFQAILAPVYTLKYFAKILELLSSSTGAAPLRNSPLQRISHGQQTLVSDSQRRISDELRLTTVDEYLKSLPHEERDTWNTISNGWNLTEKYRAHRLLKQSKVQLSSFPKEPIKFEKFCDLLKSTSANPLTPRAGQFAN